MKKIYWTLFVLFLGAGIYRMYGLKIQNYQPKTEDWLYSIVPTHVLDYSVLPGAGNRNVSYRMDPKTYDELKPIGIAGQTFSGPNGMIDAVVIAGDRMESFHDQRWCFKSQGWTITDEQKAILDIPGYGKMPIFLMKLSKGEETPKMAAFTFKTPSAFRLNYQMGQIDYLLDEFKTGHPNVGFSFRFIQIDANMSGDEFIHFIKEYMLAAKATSNGTL